MKTSAPEYECIASLLAESTRRMVTSTGDGIVYIAREVHLARYLPDLAERQF